MCPELLARESQVEENDAFKMTQSVCRTGTHVGSVTIEHYELGDDTVEFS